MWTKRHALETVPDTERGADGRPHAATLDETVTRSALECYAREGWGRYAVRGSRRAALSRSAWPTTRNDSTADQRVDDAVCGDLSPVPDD